MKVQAKRFLGGYAEGVTPVPIPNTEVKPLWVDGTARVAVWESRSPPGILLKKSLFPLWRQALFFAIVACSDILCLFGYYFQDDEL